MRCLLGFLLSVPWLASAQTNELEVATPLLPASIDPDSTVYALAIVFALTFILTFYVGVLYFRERRRVKLAKVTLTKQNSLLPTLPSHHEIMSVEEWKQRALSAETIADNQALLLRERLMPELTDFVKQSLVQGLAAQRDALLAMQQQALNSLLEMESRLAALQAPMQDRIRAYETRINELEKEISVQGAEMRELTRTILQLMRKKLDEEQAQAQTQDTFS